jgi:ElaB/YqjD/DUF883 family membrane-anchored ribosome-binding protein
VYLRLEKCFFGLLFAFYGAVSKRRMTMTKKTLKDAGNELKDSAENFATGVKSKATQAVQQGIPSGQRFQDLAQNVANGLGCTAAYLKQTDLRKMSNDAVALCRRYPAQSLATAVAVGFLIGRTRRH